MIAVRTNVATLDRSGAPACAVSIVIVSWNTRDLLRDCLASTLGACAALGRPAEVIVVDNASTDGTSEMVRREFPGVQLVENRQNAGFAAANNQGIRLRRGGHVLLLNPDTKVTPDFLRVLVGFLEANPDVGAVGPRLIDRDGAHQVSCAPLPTLGRELWRLLHLDALYRVASYPASRWATRTPQDVECIQGACLLIRGAALDEAGLLDERFFVYTEEVDLCRRLRDRGWRLMWVPAAEIVHYGGQSTRQVEARMFLELYRTKVQYFRKHAGVTGAAAYKLVLLAGALPRLVLPPLAMAFVPSRRAAWRGLVRNYTALVAELRTF